MLSPEQIESKSVTIKVKYDYIEDEENGRMYKKEILQDSSYSTQFETFDSKAGIEAYAPEEVSVELQEVEKEYRQVLESNARSITQNGALVLYDVYDIKVNLDEENEYDWKEYQDTIRFKIKNLDDNYQYTLFKYDDIDLSLTEVELSVENVGIYYAEVEELENYVLMVDSSTMTIQETETIKEIGADGASATDVWDGTSEATSFFAGTGTQTDPYIIASAAELKYFQRRVAAGVTFANQYIVLATNIDLDNNRWTPIGNNNTPFKGHFDGTGLTISNATVAANNNRYGLFGSIGDGSSQTTITNLQISGFSIGVTQTGTSLNAFAGILVGDVYQNASIENCITKNSTISVNNRVNITSVDQQYSFGGIAGRICNTANNPFANPAHTSNIINCAADVDIDSHNYTLNNNNNNLRFSVDCATGGIVGAIYYHNLFPEKCYYTGTIYGSSNFAGPIFGMMRNSTYNNANNANTTNTQFETYFNGNQTLTMTSYYGTYRFVAYTSMYASTQYTFTSSWTDGNAPQTTTYRAETTGDYFTPLLKKLYEGVNKGTYESSKNNMLTLFNNNAAAEPRYLSWELNNGQFSLVEPFTASVSTDQNYY